MFCAETNHVVAVVVQSVNHAWWGACWTINHLLFHLTLQYHFTVTDCEVHKKRDVFIIASTIYTTLLHEMLYLYIRSCTITKNINLQLIYSSFAHYFQTCSLTWCPDTAESSETGRWRNNQYLETRLECDCNWFLAELTLRHIYTWCIHSESVWSRLLHHLDVPE